MLQHVVTEGAWVSGVRLFLVQLQYLPELDFRIQKEICINMCAGRRCCFMFGHIPANCFHSLLQSASLVLEIKQRNYFK